MEGNAAQSNASERFWFEVNHSILLRTPTNDLHLTESGGIFPKNRFDKQWCMKDLHDDFEPDLTVTGSRSSVS